MPVEVKKLLKGQLFIVQHCQFFIYNSINLKKDLTNVPSTKSWVGTKIDKSKLVKVGMLEKDN